MHSDASPTPAASSDFMQQRHDDARAGAPDRVPQRDCAAADVDARRVELEPRMHAEALRRERLVQLDHVEFGRAQPRARQAPSSSRESGPRPCSSGRRRRWRRRRSATGGSIPSSFTHSSLATSPQRPRRLAARLPAVTVPPSRNAGLSFASFSSSCRARIDSSRSTRWPVGTYGDDSSAKSFCSQAAA